MATTIWIGGRMENGKRLGSSRMDDPKNWSGGVPQDGDDVYIQEGERLVGRIDANLNSLTIEGLCTAWYS